MIQRLRLLKGNEKGFTLVELLVVIVILGILASIVVFAVGGITDKGQTAACSADRSSLSSSEEAYYAQNSNYATEAQLESGGYIADLSEYHSITVDNTTTPKGYTLTGTGKCAAPTP